MLPISFKTVWGALLNAFDVRDRRVGYVIGTGASTSMAPTAHGAGSLQVDIASGNYSKNGADASTAYAGGNITLTAADATNPRVDIVYMSSGGTLSKSDGTAAAIVVGVSGPVPVAWPAGCCPLSICLVPSTATDFTSGGYVADARPFGVVPVTAAGGTPALVLGTTNTAGVATTFIRDDDTILVFDTTAPSTQAFGDAASVGIATTAPRRDHKHAMMANPLNGSGVTYTDVLWSTSFSTTSATYVSVTSGSISVTASHASNKIRYSFGNSLKTNGSTNFLNLRIRNTTDSVTIAEANVYNSSTVLQQPFTINGQVTQAASAKTIDAQIQSDGTVAVVINPQTLTNGGHLDALEIRSNG